MTPRPDTSREHGDLELALRITERIRSTLELEDVLQQTVDELGRASGASRCLLQYEPREDGTSLMVEWDRGDTRPLGYKPPTPIARRIFSTGERIAIEDVSELDDEPIAEYLRGVGSVSAVNYPILFKGRVLAVLGFHDDKPRDWTARAIPLLELVEGQVAAALAHASLWDQQLRAVIELENVNRLREELIANVSHELRTPLAAILGAVKTLRRDDVELHDGDVAKLFDVLEDQAERLRLLADDLLDLARFHAGEARLELERTRVSRLVERARAGVELAEGRAVRVELGDDLPIVADEHRMVQVLSNLLQNAAKHGRGAVLVSSERVDGHAVIAVSDEGDGVAPAFEDEVFQPFAHHGNRSDSSGLGLPIARRIVEAHGGTLVYEPADGDRRHRFVVRLPYRETAPRG